MYIVTYENHKTGRVIYSEVYMTWAEAYTHASEQAALMQNGILDIPDHLLNLGSAAIRSEHINKPVWFGWESPYIVTMTRIPALITSIPDSNYTVWSYRVGDVVKSKNTCRVHGIYAVSGLYTLDLSRKINRGHTLESVHERATCDVIEMVELAQRYG